MAVNDLYQVRIHWNDSRTEMSTTFFVKQTNLAGTAELAAQACARAVWADLVDAGGPLPGVLADDCHVNSVFVDHYLPPVTPNNQAPGRLWPAKEVGLRPGQPLPGADALKIMVQAQFGAPAKTVTNYISISGISEDEVLSGSWKAAFLDPPVKALVDAIGAGFIDVVSGDTFTTQCAFQPKGPGRDWKDPTSVRTTSRILNQRRRYSERIGSA